MDEGSAGNGFDGGVPGLGGGGADAGMGGGLPPPSAAVMEDELPEGCHCDLGQSGSLPLGFFILLGWGGLRLRRRYRMSAIRPDR